MKDYQREFIELAIAKEALLFGQFTLKSGRLSPYFFNAGRFFQTGAGLAALGRFYAAAVMDADLDFGLIFGPAYKGIPLASATAIALAERHGRDLPYCFNRKEAKDHGEGGSLVGASLAGRVLIVDDVITAGTAIREVMGLLADAGATPAGVLVGLDRQERGQGSLSAIQEVEAHYRIPVISLVNLNDIMRYLEQTGGHDKLEAMRAYRAEFGVQE